jgi:hypothetical protein
MDHEATCNAIQVATTEEQVIAAVRKYLSSLSDEETASMPAELIALGRSHAENIVGAALKLVNDEMRSVIDAPGSELLRGPVLVLATASRRLATLAAYKA